MASVLYLSVQSPSRPAEESEDVGAEVPAAVTVEVEEIHPLPEVCYYVCLFNVIKLHIIIFSLYVFVCFLSLYYLCLLDL